MANRKPHRLSNSACHCNDNGKVRRFPTPNPIPRAPTNFYPTNCRKDNKGRPQLAPGLAFANSASTPVYFPSRARKQKEAHESVATREATLFLRTMFHQVATRMARDGN